MKTGYKVTVKLTDGHYNVKSSYIYEGRPEAVRYLSSVMQQDDCVLAELEVIKADEIKYGRIN